MKYSASFWIVVSALWAAIVGIQLLFPTVRAQRELLSHTVQQKLWDRFPHSGPLDVTWVFTSKASLAKQLQNAELDRRHLQEKMVRLEAVEKEYQALQRQVASNSGAIAKAYPARLVATPTQVVVLAGEQEGVHGKAAVVFDGRLVGRIQIVTAHTATVDMLTNPGQPVLITHPGSSQQALLSKTRQGLVAQFFSVIPVKEGDILMSIPESATEEALPIGTVKKIVSTLSDPYTKVVVDIPPVESAPTIVFIDVE